MLKMQLKTIIACMGMILVALLGSSFGQSDDNEAFLNRKVEWGSGKLTVEQACAQLATKGVPVGFEAMEGKSAQQFVQPKNGTVREILNSISNTDTGFAWEVRDGVVNVYPVRSRDEVLRTFLATKLQAFPGEMELEDFGEFIQNSEEVKAFLGTRQTELGIFSGSGNSPTKASLEKFVGSNSELRALLNQAVKSDSRGKWWSIQRSVGGGILLVF